MKIYLIAGMLNYTDWIEDVELVDSIEKADLVLFEGGADVSPYVYNETNINPRTYSDPARDEYEVKEFLKAVALDKYILGICRGSQLSCAMAGGKLVQDQPNPSHIHDMITDDGRVIKVTSTHHQAQFPFNLPEDDYKIIGWTENMLNHHHNGKEEEMNPSKECEIVYYKKIKALAIQPHPEMLINKWTYKAHEGFEDSISYFREVLSKFMNNEYN